MLLAPASAAAQSAGDDQYQDPFGGEDQGQTEPEATPAPPAQEPAAPPPAEPAAPAPSAAPDAAPAAPATAQPQLPYTGLDAGAILLIGTVLLAGGVALRVRLRDPR